MSNRRYQEFSQGKITEDKPRPSPSLGNAGKMLSTPETQPPYQADIGPGGPDLNRAVGYPKVKVYLKSKMSPEIGADMPQQLPSVQPMAQPGPSFVTNEGINAAPQNQVADAARQGVFRKN